MLVADRIFNGRAIAGWLAIRHLRGPDQDCSRQCSSTL